MSPVPYWLTRLIEDLPGKRAALFPTHSFGPNKDRFILSVADHCWVLATNSLAWRGDRFGYF